MKLVSTATLIAALSFSAITFAQSGDMGGMKMEGKGMQNCMDMKGMKDMDMKDIDAKKCQDMMKDIDAKGTAKTAPHDAAVQVQEVHGAVHNGRVGPDRAKHLHHRIV